MKKVIITKSPGNAETITVETTWDGTASGWAADVEPVLARLDRRMFEQNMRMLRGGLRVGGLPPEAAAAARDILRMVNGVNLEQAQVEALALVESE